MEWLVKYCEVLLIKLIIGCGRGFVMKNGASPPNGWARMGKTCHTEPVKRVVSVSLGSSSRDALLELPLLGEKVRLERRGVDGNLAKAAALIGELDGQVDAIGLGGIDLYAYIGTRRYVLQDAAKLARHAKQTPVVCGAGLKTFVEGQMIERLDARFQWANKRVLMTSAVDRYGMAQAFVAAGADVTLGDVIFVLGLPVGIGSLQVFRGVASILLPLAFRLPFAWLYPTGAKQDDVTAPPARFARFYQQADVIAGDWHYIRRYMPPRLDGKIIVTNTTTAANLTDLQARGVAAVITTTPRVNGRSLPTNLLEAALVAVRGFPLQEADYAALAGQLEPDVQIQMYQ
jgi:hypothetical protein